MVVIIKAAILLKIVNLTYPSSTEFGNPAGKNVSKSPDVTLWNPSLIENDFFLVSKFIVLVNFSYSIILGSLSFSEGKFWTIILCFLI